jgi:hypothetical protein
MDGAPAVELPVEIRGFPLKPQGRRLEWGTLVGLDGDFVFDAAAILDFGHGLVGFE